MDHQAMISAIDQNFNLHASTIAKQTREMEVQESSSLTLVDSRLSCDTFNIIHITNGRKLEREELGRAIHHFKSQSSDYCIWINEAQLSQTKGLFSEYFLEQQGEEVGMILQLDQYEPIDAEYHQLIKIGSRPQDLEAYAQVIADHWTPRDENVLAYYQQTVRQYLNEKNRIRLLLFYMDHQPVATLELFPSNDQVVGIYGLATKKAYRRKGIGSAMMTFALNLAKREGYQQVVLQASEDGLGIYEKYGFEAQEKYYEYGESRVGDKG